MQAVYRRSAITLARQPLRASVIQARYISSSSPRFDDKAAEAAEVAAKKADAAKDSLKRGAKNTTGVIGKAAKGAINLLKDMGDAARSIASDGRAEGRDARKEAGKMVKDRVSGKDKAAVGTSQPTTGANTTGTVKPE